MDSRRAHHKRYIIANIVQRGSLSARNEPEEAMSTVTKTQNPEADPRVKAVFDDIRTTRKSDFINNMWLYLAFDPDLLEKTWAEVKAVMATPSALDPLVKEMLYIAVSVTNGC